MAERSRLLCASPFFPPSNALRFPVSNDADAHEEKGEDAEVLEDAEVGEDAGVTVEFTV
jgi:hypothetical protein